MDEFLRQEKVMPRGEGNIKIKQQISVCCFFFVKLEFVELIIPYTTAKRQELFALVILLSCRIQHILYKNSVSPRRVSHQYMSHRANQLSVLDDGTAAHE